MPAWITTYLQRSPQELDADEVRKGIADADWWTLAEDFEIDSEAVDRFMAALGWQDEPLQVGLPDARPIKLHVWTESDRVEDELGELPPQQGPVRDHLTDTCAVVAIELGWSQLRSMHEVLAFEIAYWLAERFQGVILAPDDRWYDSGEHRWEPYEDGS